ncbi:MAG: hypothetical protein IJU30_03695 [Lachnospiraceae bacterium]|nr:hypothetical protein [Lachnospiraceae bacterium]
MVSKVADKRINNNFNNSGKGSSRRKNGGGGSPWVIAAAVAVVALVAVFAMVMSSRRKQAEIAASEAESASIEASIAASIAEEEANRIEVKELTPCEIPELQLLVQEYFEARLAGDTTRIFEMYGRSDTAADEALSQKLKAQAAWIQTFRNISVYDAAGVYDGDRFCVVQYDVDFRRTDTLAPGIMYFYAERSADGGYIFLENLVKERVDFVEAELKSPQTEAMISDTDSRLKEALDTDSELALIYTSFRNGEIYKEANLDMDREQEVDLFLDPEDSILVEGATLPAVEETVQDEAAADTAAEESGTEAPAEAAEETAAEEAASEENAPETDAPSESVTEQAQ